MTANLPSLDASLAFLTRVLCFKDSKLRRCTLVRPVPTGQNGQAHWSDRTDAPTPPSLVLRSTKEPSVLPVNHRKPRELDVASANHHS
jgi:hypothetical protein